ncbi:MAG: hypothetical protein ABSH30_01395 [Acidimicrobiales bacterium]
MQRRRQVVNQDGAVVREVRRASWSPSQLVAVVAGILLVVLGGVGLARAGTSFSHLAFAHSQVAGLGVTPLSALAELAVGVLVLAGGAYPGSAKGTTSFFGVVLLAFGLIVALDDKPFFKNWAYTRGNGIFFIVVGAVLLVTAAVSPIFSSRRAVVVERASTSQADLQAGANSPPPTTAQPTGGTVVSNDPIQPVQYR